MAFAFIAIACCFTFFTAMIFAVPLYTAGYESRVRWNNELVQTSCLNTKNDISTDSCAVTCCAQLCVENPDGSVTCSENCTTCFETCYHLSCTFVYYVNSTNSAWTKTYNDGTTFSYAAAVAKLASDCPVGSNWTCYYLSSDPGTVVSSYYEPKVYFGFAMFFFAIMAMAGIASCGSGLAHFFGENRGSCRLNP